MTKHNQKTLARLEEIFALKGFKIRYEKGDFQSGYCIVENQKVIVINKFFKTDSRIHTLIEIIKEFDIDLIEMDRSSREVVKRLSMS